MIDPIEKHTLLLADRSCSLFAARPTRHIEIEGIWNLKPGLTAFDKTLKVVIVLSTQ